MGPDFNITKNVMDRHGNMQYTWNNLTFMDFIADLDSVDLELKGRDFT